jgi:hypothetical protein
MWRLLLVIINLEFENYFFIAYNNQKLTSLEFREANVPVKSVGYNSGLWRLQGDRPICSPLNSFLGRGMKFLLLHLLLLLVERLRKRETLFFVLWHLSCRQ